MTLHAYTEFHYAACNLCWVWKSSRMIVIRFAVLYPKCRYDECRYAECCGVEVKLCTSGNDSNRAKSQIKITIHFFILVAFQNIVFCAKKHQSLIYICDFTVRFRIAFWLKVKIDRPHEKHRYLGKVVAHGIFVLWKSTSTGASASNEQNTRHMGWQGILADKACGPFNIGTRF